MMDHVESIETEFNIKVWKTGSNTKLVDETFEYTFEEEEDGEGGYGEGDIKYLANTREVTIILTIKKWIIKVK